MSEMGSIIEYQDDLSEAEAPKALPGGDYPGEIVSAEIGVSQNSGKSRVDVTFRISPEDFPPDYEDADSYPDGKYVHFYPSAETDKANRYRTKQFCEAIGAKMGKKLDVNDWIGKRAILTNEPEEFEGIDRERIRRVSAL